MCGTSWNRRATPQADAAPSGVSDGLSKLIAAAADCISEAVTFEQDGFDTAPMPATQWDYNADQLAYALRAELAAIAAGGAQEAVAWMYSSTRGVDLGRMRWSDDMKALGPADMVETPLYAAPLPRVAATAPFQQRVQPWMLACFGAEIAADRIERNHRFFEEATELVQACGMTASEAHQLVDYTFGRPVGEPSQEVGGVMVTLAALCLANRLDMHDAGETELARINVPETVAKIRAKQAAKPKHSPLPAAPAAASNGELE